LEIRDIHEFVVKSIVVGEISDDLSQACLNHTLIGPDELTFARKEDQEALALLQVGSYEAVEDAKRFGEQKMDEYLSLLSQA
jgi:hypothetical protein